jgi:hypothetical protein
MLLALAGKDHLLGGPGKDILVGGSERRLFARGAKKLAGLLTPLACSSSLMDALTSALQGTTLTTSLRGWRKLSRASDSSHCGVGELAANSV